MRTASRMRSFAAFFGLVLAATVAWSAAGQAEGGAGSMDRCYTCD